MKEADFMSIPLWNQFGVLPPADINEPTSPNRSPYKVSLREFIERYAINPQRCNILRGYLEYRAALRERGIRIGFQWVDGSFLENVEVIQGRTPNDIDVVTYYVLPEGVNQQAVYNADPTLFDLTHVKNKYHVDGYFIDILNNNPKYVIDQTAYWYSVWSHRRNDMMWKGYLEISLESSDDGEAITYLDGLIARGGQA